MGKKLGEGRFGTVYTVFHKATGAIFAMKKIAKSTIRQNFMIEQFILEVKIQFFIEHAYVVRLFGIFDDEENIYLLLEYLEGGTLYSELKRKAKGKMTEQETATRIRMICQAIGCLHQKGIAHRDIKPENIIITNVTNSPFRIPASWRTSAGPLAATSAGRPTAEPLTTLLRR
jgi:serine/threonine protein kinase